MSLANDTELANTRAKLARLEKLYHTVRADVTGDVNVREVSLRSLKRTINQFREEIARYQSRQPARG
jgi:hypothetical protein